MANMAGMMSGGNDDFSWNSNTIFDKIGNPEMREEYLTELSGTGNKEREMIEQLRSLDETEMKSILYDLPDEDKQEFIQDYYNLNKQPEPARPTLDIESMSMAPEMTVEGPEPAPSYGMMDPDEKLELKAEVLF
tara:strand:+ start:1658 stop:2059 length:402 start_codon:yes stop_codon:yes gene_type:complete